MSGFVQILLAQGSGARRLAEAKCRAGVQLLLVQVRLHTYAHAYVPASQLESTSKACCLMSCARRKHHSVRQLLI